MAVNMIDKLRHIFYMMGPMARHVAYSLGLSNCIYFNQILLSDMPIVDCDCELMVKSTIALEIFYPPSS